MIHVGGAASLPLSPTYPHEPWGIHSKYQCHTAEYVVASNFCDGMSPKSSHSRQILNFWMMRSSWNLPLVRDFALGKISSWVLHSFKERSTWYPIWQTEGEFCFVLLTVVVLCLQGNLIKICKLKKPFLTSKRIWGCNLSVIAKMLRVQKRDTKKKECANARFYFRGGFFFCR